MSYRIESLVTEQLFGPAMRATEALVRLDERIARSPVAKGFVERSHFADAASSLWLDGELVHVEDLVLHDAHMDRRTPTHELTRPMKSCASGSRSSATGRTGRSVARGATVSEPPDCKSPGSFQKQTALAFGCSLEGRKACLDHVCSARQADPEIRGPVEERSRHHEDTLIR